MVALQADTEKESRAEREAEEIYSHMMKSLGGRKQRRERPKIVSTTKGQSVEVASKNVYYTRALGWLEVHNFS